MALGPLARLVAVQIGNPVEFVPMRRIETKKRFPLPSAGIAE
jgi:hypothetical protein